MDTITCPAWCMTDHADELLTNIELALDDVPLHSLTMVDRPMARASKERVKVSVSRYGEDDEVVVDVEVTGELTPEEAVGLARDLLRAAEVALGCPF